MLCMYAHTERTHYKLDQRTFSVKIYTDYLSCRSYSLLSILVQLMLKQTPNNKMQEQIYQAYFHFYIFSYEHLANSS